MLERVLEPEVMDDREEAVAYNDMNHDAVNDKFAEDLLALGDIGTDCLDIGTGTARIPVALCKKHPEIRIMACDASYWMLELARYNIEVEQCAHRVQLHLADAKKLVFQKDYFDTVFSNSLVHHLPEHADFFHEMVRVLRPNGVVFLRDLLRPETSVQVESLVQKYGGEDSHGQQMLRQSLHAALRLEEVRNLAAAVGIPSECVQVTSDRHWTLAARANESKQIFVPISIAPEPSDPHSVALGKSDAT